MLTNRSKNSKTKKKQAISKLISHLQSKKIAIWGFGLEGKATFEFLQSHFPNKEIIIIDKTKPQQQTNKSITFLQQTNNQANTEKILKNLITKKFTIIKSPGIPTNNYNLSIIKKITTQNELFLKFFAKQSIGISGTKGKSTCAKILYQILKAHKIPVKLIGNIGNPAFSVLKNLNYIEKTIFVYELSSYQLENCRYSPSIAILLNLYQDHLNYHTNLKNYWHAKYNLFLQQKKCDKLLINKKIYPLIKNQKIKAIIKKITLKKAYKITQKYQISSQDMQNLPGEHNLLNLAFALKAAQKFKLQKQTIKKTLTNFKALAHRLEFVGIFNGTKYYNDSISTIPQATAAALNSLPNCTHLIIGGYDRGIDYSFFWKNFLKTKVQYLICIGQTGKKISDLLKEKSVKKNIIYTKTLENAVKFVQKNSKKNSVCLFSPAAASHDQFINFEERGELFKKICKKKF